MRPPLVATAAAVVLALAACKSSTGPGGPTANVSIQDFSFSPETVTVTPGTTVLWTNNGPSAHNVTSDSSDSVVFHSATISAPSGGGGYGYGTGPGSYSHRFPTAGVFPYHCTIHGFAGVVVVTAGP
ncbi:MAG TPA: plastocyanin/azurin family copper-binding protein [Gemmatimonadales bacterium]|nr:plastocyanin/azurin family copper-binding protein [Gemmatimonadales bacterium]